MKQNPSQQGFTLIEMMISMLIFSVVAVTGAGALLKIIDAGKKAQTLKSVTNNLHYALETMSREIRMGTTFHCDDISAAGSGNVARANDCPDGDQYFAFESPDGDPTDDGDQFAYYLDPSGQLMKSESGGHGGFYPVTAPEVHLTYLRFYVTGAEHADDPVRPTVPRVLISMKGYVTKGKDSSQSEFSIQSTITQRIHN